MSRRWTRIAALAEEALRRPTGERDAFLDEACGDNPSLGDAVRALLAAGLKHDAFLEPLVGEPDAAPALRPGQRVGPFRILEPVGEGSMGVVFAAEQDSPRRRVALKLMREPLLTPARRQRFRFEVEALGALNHPHIAQIHQAGIHRDASGPIPREVPYFAMEFVEGAATLRAHAEGAGLGTRDRLRLLIHVCEAVHHGHQKGIIHRDLKPENLLVDAAGRPKVIDFGVARVVDAERVLRTVRTQAREIVGTLPYMSPEQARGQAADVRSDVYALGAVLYELLTGELPVAVDAGDFLTSARRIAEEPPRRPTRFRPDIGRDLEAVVLKALEKEPQDRYASAEAFAADLQRVVRQEPVEARIPTPLDRWRAFSRRHRALVVAGTVVAVALVAATAVSLEFAVASGRAEALARARSEEADAERQRATRLFEHALERGLAVTWRVTPRIHELPGGAPVAADLMAATVGDLRGLEDEAGDDPVVLLALAQAYLRFGDIRGNPVVANLRDPDEAAASYTRGLELAQRAARGPWRVAAARTAAQALRRRAELRQMIGPDDATTADLEQALDLLEVALPRASGGAAAKIRFEGGLVHHLLSVDAKGRSDLERAEHHARAALEHLEEFAASEYRDLDDVDRHIAAKSYWLGVVLVARDRLEEARASFERATRVAEALPPTRQQRLDLALYRFGRGASARRLGRFEEADRDLEACIEAFVALREEDSTDPRILPHLIGTSMEWVVAGDRERESGAGPITEEGRRRARAAAARLRAVAPDSRIVDMFAKRLESPSEGE